MSEERVVIIEVLGGVAYVKSCPDDVTVIIRDYDNEDDSDDGEPTEDVYQGDSFTPSQNWIIGWG